MTAKRYLERIEDLWSVYEMAAEKERKMREQIYAFPAIRYDKEHIDHSVEDMMSENLARLADYGVEVNRKLTAYMMAVDDLQKLLEKIKNPNHRLIIWYRYVNEYPIKVIADKMALSVSWIKHMYVDAFRAMEEMPELKDSTQKNQKAPKSTNGV